MVFWLGILVGAVFIGLAVRIGLYEMWVTLFNIVIAIYIAIFTGPTIAEFVPGADESHYTVTVTIAVAAIALFAILQSITYVAFTSQLKVNFPRVLDNLGAGALGFVSGLLVWSFVYLIICLSPVSQDKTAQKMGFGSQSQQSNLGSLFFFCDLINNRVASDDNKQTTKMVVDAILKDFDHKINPQRKKKKTADPNDPNDTKEDILE